MRSKSDTKRRLTVIWLDRLTKNPTFIPMLQLVVGTIMISFSAPFVKMTTTEPTIDGFYRMFLGGLGLLIVMAFRRKKITLNPQSLFYALLCGLLFAADLAFWHKSILTIGPGLATVLVNLQVFVLAVVGLWVYGDKINWKYGIALPLAGLGLYFLVGISWTTFSSHYKLGIFQSLISMTCYSMYIISLRKSQTIPKAFDPITNLAIISLSSAILLAVIAGVQHESFIPQQPSDWFWLSLYALFGQVLGWSLITMGVARISISQAGLILLLQPALSMIWDTFFFNRPTKSIEVLGIFLILTAIYFGNTGHQTKGG